MILSIVDNRFSLISHFIIDFKQISGLASVA